MWLRDFNDVIELARGAGSVGSHDVWLEGLLIDDPEAGRVQGGDAVSAFMHASQVWLEERAARPIRLATIEAEGRVVAEYTITVGSSDGDVVVPLAVVVEPVTHASKLWLRIYCSLWTLTKAHLLRPPLLQPDAALRVPGIPGEYIDRLRDGDAEACAACYEPDGCLQGPGGPLHARCGTAALRAVYGEHLIRGGIDLQPCTVTDDGTRAAVEFNIVRWGDVTLPPQAGISTYQRGRTGRLARNRVYDDVGRPWS